MSKQYWADASTQNCVWLLQTRDIPNACYREAEEQPEDAEFPVVELDPDNAPHDNQCWSTIGVYLHRLEAFAAGARRVYNYGQYGVDWRIYGVSAHGDLVTLLANAGVNQDLIDNEVKVYKQERPEWEKEDERLVDKS